MGRHPNIHLLTNSEVDNVTGHVGNFSVRIRRKPRFIDETLCTGCGQCAEVCPIDVESSFDYGLSKRKAVYRNSPQAVPNAFTIDKQGVAPCRDACPTGQRAMGYIALLRQKRYADAYWAIRREHPFPSVCGRVCNHRCEDACSRGQVDEPVNIMGLKRFISDWAYANRGRLPDLEVGMLCLEPRGEMPGFDWEIQVAEEEGVRLYPGRVFKEIVIHQDKIAGVRCAKVHFAGFVDGQPVIDEIPATGHIVPADIVIWAIGQRPDFGFLPPDGRIQTLASTGILTDAEMMTTLPGVFAAGDVNRGMTFFVVDAIAEGHRVARSVDRTLRPGAGLDEPVPQPVAHLDLDTIQAGIDADRVANTRRIPIPSIPLAERRNNFREVDLTMTEAEALREAERCVQCGTCAECLECVAACERHAIDHEMLEITEEYSVGAIVLATGFQDFDPKRAPEYGYGLPNVITAMEFERMISTSGPTGGRVLLKNGQPPQRVAIVHCVGSRDENHHQFCSRVCCMYSLKIAQLVHEYVGAEVFEIYRDMRTFGKDYEEFYNRIHQKGVHFYHGIVTSVARENGHLTVRWDQAYFNEPDNVEVDMVILSTALEPQSDAEKVASIIGVSRGPDGFFLGKHPKLAPLEAATDGIFLAGACQGPKDIPDSVIQAGGAAGAALSLIDQEIVLLDPSIAQVDPRLCMGCGQCVETCPYEAILVNNGHAEVNSFQCKGCGTCAGACPNKAMELAHYDDHQLVAELIGVLQ